MEYESLCFFGFVLIKLPGYKVVCGPGTIHFKKKQNCFEYENFFLENGNHEEVYFNGETLTYTLQFIKI